MRQRAHGIKPGLRIWALLLVLSAVLLASCGIGAQPVATPQGSATLPGGNLIMALGEQDPTTIDPALVADTVSAFVARQLFSGLVRLDDQLEVQPDLAERWEIAPDGRTYTFTLRADARFADGTTISSADVSYSLERASDPTLGANLPAQTYLRDIEGVREKLAGTATTLSGVRVIDERTIAISISAPRSYFLAKLANPTAYVVDRRSIEANPSGWTERPNGSGPFVIEEWQHNRQMVLKRNINYYGNLARLDRVTLLMGAAASNPLVLYEEGEIDITSVPSYALARLRDGNNPLAGELVSVPQLSLNYIGMNVTTPPFDNPKVRQAFSLLIDRAKLAEVSLNGSGQAARGILPPGMPGYNAQLPAPVVDIAQARRLLAEAGYADTSQFPPIAAYGGAWVEVLRDIAREELGISIEARNFEDFGTFLDALNSSQLPLFDIAWIADYPDPQNFLDLLFRSDSAENETNYANPQVDALLDQAANARDETARWQYYQQAEQLILADAPVIPLYHDVEHTLIKPYVKGLTVTPMGILNLATVELVR